MLTLQLPDNFPNLPRVIPVGDADGHVVFACVHVPSQAGETAYAAAYLVDARRETVILIGADDLPSKTSGVDVLLVPGTTPTAQTVELWVTEAGTAGGPGSSNVTRIYRFEDAVPGRVPLATIDLDARRQALAATNIAKAALEKTNDAALAAVRGLAAALVSAAAQYD